MPPSRIPKNLPKPKPIRVREGMSQEHWEQMHELPCLGCGKELNIQAHHLLRTEEHGGSYKSSDRWLVPLCFDCHDPRVTGSVHHDGDEDGWMADRGIDGRGIASALWTVRGDVDAMRRIVERSLLTRGVYRNA